MITNFGSMPVTWPVWIILLTAWTIVGCLYAASRWYFAKAKLKNGVRNLVLSLVFGLLSCLIFQGVVTYAYNQGRQEVPSAQRLETGSGDNPR